MANPAPQLQKLNIHNWASSWIYSPSPQNDPGSWMVAEAVKCFLTLDLDIIFLGVQIQSVRTFFCHGYVSYHNLMRVILDVISISLSIAWSLPFFTTFFLVRGQTTNCVCVFTLFTLQDGAPSRARVQKRLKKWLNSMVYGRYNMI